MHALKQALTTGVNPAPLVGRLLPVQACCTASIDVIVSTLETILRPFGAGSGHELYKVELKQHCDIHVDSSLLIKAIDRLVIRISPHAKLNLTHAHTAIMVDVFD